MLSENGPALALLLLGIAAGLVTCVEVGAEAAWVAARAGDAGASSRDREAAPAGQRIPTGRLCDYPKDRTDASGENDRALMPLIRRAHNSGRLTYHPSNDSHPAFSPDRAMVVFVSDRDGRSDVFRVPTNGGPAIGLTQTALAEEDTPVFSPDGSRIAFASNRSGDWDIYTMDPVGDDVRVAVGNPASDEQHPSFTPDGRVLAFSSDREAGNWDIYTATVSGDGPWVRLTSDPAVDRFPTVSADGTMIAFRSDRDGDSEIYVMQADGSGLRQITDDAAFDGHPILSPDGSGIVFGSTRSGRESTYLVNLAGEGLIDLEQDPGWRAVHARTSPDGGQLLFAGGPGGQTLEIYRREFTSPLLAIGRRGSADAGEQCNWEEGVLALGWIHAWQATGDEQYGEWVEGWVGACTPLKTEISHVNDGLLGYAALALYQASGEPKYLAFANRVADYLLNLAPRTSDGTLTHDSHRVWVDTLLGAVPFLSEMGRISGNDIYIEEAITQTLKHAAHLQDPGSGLYYHAWDETKTHSAGHVFWGRGNGWALLADVMLLPTITGHHPSRAAVLDKLERHAAGLRTLQDPSGLWHTVLTRPDSHLESSASSLIGYGFACGARHGWFDDEIYSASAQSARLAVWRTVLADGTVTHVSGATWPMATEEEYNARPNDELQLYGQGSALLLESPPVHMPIASRRERDRTTCLPERVVR